ncbi:MAG: hypothetical protein ABOK23_11625 [Candidatus Methanoperedens sp.]|nr:hypothetical protein [Candidatus Methanoperedens sp.]MCZ7395194.1 hypothetical protein [Candidatus Methanoperedens sp.]
MRKLTQFIVSIFLITFLINTTYGFPVMVNNNSNAQPGNITQFGQANRVLLNTTQSDQDIRLLQHLIEVDAVQFQSENKSYVRETLIFKNAGTQNFSGSLRTWVPDGAEIIKRNDTGEIAKNEMTTGTTTDYLPIIQNGNVVSWHDDIETNSLASFYIIEYLVTAKPEVTLNKTLAYTKMLTYPTLINYQYVPSQDMPPLVLIITKPNGSSVNLTDENGNDISPSDVTEQGNTVTNRFYEPRFKELNIEISKQSITQVVSKPVITPAQLAGYVIIGLLILLALSYPVIRKRSEKLQALEGKIKSSLKREKAQESEEEAALETVEKTIEGEAVEEDTGLEGKTRDELLSLKNEILSKLGELDKDYESGNLLDEEYEELRKPYQEKIQRITGRIKRSG